MPGTLIHIYAERNCEEKPHLVQVIRCNKCGFENRMRVNWKSTTPKGAFSCRGCQTSVIKIGGDDVKIER